MPIHFACEHCNQRLSVGSKKAGTQSRCPKCERTILVPGDREFGGHHEDPPPATMNDSDDDNPYAQFAVFDAPGAWTYADESLAEEPSDDSRPDSSKVSIPRKVIYLQGILLGLVAVGCFAAGVMVGSNAAGRRSNEAQGPTPCVISGQVTYRDSGGELAADAGAVVIALPQAARPEQRANVEGLRATDPLPADLHSGIQIIRQIGGNYIRADTDGKFQLRLPDTGQYFVLFLSRNRSRPSGQLSRKDLAQIGRYFDPATELLADKDYRWSEVVVMRKDRAVDHVFQ